MKSYYTILGVCKTSTTEEIKKAYKKLVLINHPDRGGDSDCFKQINEAYQILSDPDKKKQYDILQEKNTFLSNIFNLSIFKNKNIRYDVCVSLQDIYNGKLLKCSYNKKIRCKACNGKGIKREVIDIAKCYHCLGVILSCSYCNGTGVNNIEYLCNSCNGKKFVMKNDIFSVNIPKGIQHGEKIVLKSIGDEYPHNVIGDVILIVNEKPHNLFKRKGNHLQIIKDITLKESLCGTSFSLLTLDNRNIEIKKDGIIEPNHIQIIDNEGIKSGKLFIIYNVIFPKKLSNEQLKNINFLFK